MLRATNCSTCGTQLNGRSDKVFCSSKCKNQHHRNAKFQTPFGRYLKSSELKRNYVIFTGMLGTTTEKLIIDYKLLFKSGFDVFSFQNNLIINKIKYMRIGEFIFRRLNNGLIEIIRLENLMRFSKMFFDRWRVIFGEVGDFFGLERLSFDGKRIERSFFKDSDVTAKPFINNT